MTRHSIPSDVNALTLAADYLCAKGFHPTLAEEYRFELLNARHSADVVRWRNNPENRHAFFQAKTLTLEDQANFLETYEARHRVDLVLTTGALGKAVGVFALARLDTDPEFGLLIGDKSYRGRGLATAATIAMLQFGFDWLRLPRIWAHTQPTNKATGRLNAKMGFTVDSEVTRNGVAYWRFVLSRERFAAKALICAASSVS